MSITSAASGITVNTPAKDSRLTETTLGSQAGANADQVIVPNAIGTNNEGNLVASPVYPGRMVWIRPDNTRVLGSFASTAGSGYVVGDVLTIAGGTLQSGASAATFRVTQVNGSGGVLNVQILTAGEYTVNPTLANSATGGSGTGVVITATMGFGGEWKFVVADASNTLTVHEDWTIAPASGDEWALSYIIQDVATVTGMSLLTKRIDDYGASRPLIVGAGTNPAWLFFGEGVSLETDNPDEIINGIFRVSNNARFDMGYLAGGVPVSGAALFFGGAGSSADDDLAFSAKEGSECFLYSSTAKGVRNYEFAILGHADVDTLSLFGLVTDFFVSGQVVLNYSNVRNIVLESRGLTGDTLNFGRMTSTVIDGINIINADGTAGLETDSTWQLRNPIFINNQSLVNIQNNASDVGRMVSPIWSPDRTTQGDINFAGTVNGTLEELYELDLTVTDTAGTAIVGATAKVIENLLNDDIPHGGVTLTGGKFGRDILKETMTPDGTASGITRVTKGDFALHVNDYGNVPFVGPLPVNAKDVRSVALGADPAITEATQATAITNGSGITLTSHGAAGDTDIRPLTVIAYDGGVGTVPVNGLTVTGAGGATGVVVDFEGDAVSGLLILETRNATAFVDNENITDTGTFDASADLVGGTGVNETYRWEIDANALTMTVVYDYLAARMAEDSLTAPFDDVHVWGEDEHAAILFSGTGGFFTNRNVNNAEGVWVHNRGGGTIDFFTADDGTQVSPPVTVSVTFDGMRDNTEVWVFPTGVKGIGNEIAEIEEATAGTPDDRSFTWSAPAGTVVDYIIHNFDETGPDFQTIRVNGFTVPVSDVTIVIQQVLDRNSVD